MVGSKRGAHLGLTAVGRRLAVRGPSWGASLLFLLVNVLCAVLSRRRRAQPWALLLVRVLVAAPCCYLRTLLPPASALWPGGPPPTSIYLEAKVGPQALMPGCLWGRLGSSRVEAGTSPP